MKIGILSQNKELYSTWRLIEAAEQKGHDVRVINPLRCFMDVNARKPSVHFSKEILDFDAVIPRIAASITYYATAVVRQFEMSGAYALNGSLSITRSRDKLRAHQILAKRKIDMPDTSFAYFTSNSEELIDIVGGAPLIIKLLSSAQGKGVVLADTKNSAKALVEAFLNLDAQFIVQEFIKESDGADIRCFVVGDKVVASMMRQSGEGDFRSNLHSGGTAKKVKISPAERKIAVKAAQAMGLDVAGVDLVRSERGPLILEVNSSPGLEGIEGSSQKDIASMMIEYVENNAHKTREGRTHKG